MNFFEQRRWRKVVKHALHESRHARHMREDIADAADLAALREAETRLTAAWRERNRPAIEAALDQLGEKLDRVSPQRPQPKMRENVEILAVAVAVAMGFRTYFIQPFKIPTGSMQPTLYGISVTPQAKRGLMDTFPLNLVRLALLGERYVEIRAKASGQISLMGQTEDSDVFSVGGLQHRIRRDMARFPLSSPFVSKGQVLASGLVRQGDHIFVNKVIYNFAKPKRGDIFVFETSGVDHPSIRKDSFYIKRLAGLPGERISIDPPYLKVNGERVTSPYPFRRLVEQQDKGYAGYQLPDPRGSAGAILTSPESVLPLAAGQYLPLGDNTRSSLDGRYFGAVNEKSIVGPAFMVYWPFGHRWGLVQ